MLILDIPAPAAKKPDVAATPSANPEEQAFAAKIVAQGNTVRDLKAAKAEAAAVTAEVDKLKALKAEYKTKFGKEYAPAPGIFIFILLFLFSTLNF